MDSYVLDTHAWVWQLVYPAKLGKAALGILQAADKGEVQVRIPAVVLAEFLMIAEKQRVPGLTRPVAESVIEQIRRHPGYVLTSLTPELVMASRAHVAIPDIFDRLIATEAQSEGLPLLTCDPVIVGSGLVEVVWG